MKKISLKAISFAAVLLLGSLAFAGSENPQIQKGIELHNLSRSAEGEDSDAMIDESLAVLEPFIEKDTLALITEARSRLRRVTTPRKAQSKHSGILKKAANSSTRP